MPQIETGLKACVSGCQAADHERFGHAEFIVWTYGIGLPQKERDLLLEGWEHGWVARTLKRTRLSERLELRIGGHRVHNLTLADAILRNDTTGHYTCWMDEDGRHVWQHHVCVGLPEESMLPRGTYKFWTEQEGRVVPSINCERCGLHEVQVPVYKAGNAEECH